MTQTLSLALPDHAARRDAALLKALVDPIRLTIIRLLIRHDGTLSVQEIVDRFPVEQPTISHHLHILLDAALIDYEKRGLYVYYRVRPRRLDEAMAVLSGLRQKAGKG